MPSTAEHAHAQVKEYYGSVLHSGADLKTSACCAADTLPAGHREILAQIAPEVLDKFYGCGAPIPPALEGCRVLDLGCGTGRDAYLCSALVGESGSVIGVDMTEEQLEVARRHLPEQMQRFGYQQPNVSFVHGYIEDLAACGIPDNSIDVVISNCVINLSTEKERVFREIFRVLKPGGEMYVSDVFADRRLPEALMTDPVLHCECLAGAMYTEDFRRLMLRLGCPDVRQVSKSEIMIHEADVRAAVGDARFYSITMRAFKLDGLEDRCEDYGQTITYRGGLPEFPDAFPLDMNHLLRAGDVFGVCGNTSAMLSETRYGPYFEVRGDRATHYGVFACGAGGPPSACARSACC